MEFLLEKKLIEKIEQDIALQVRKSDELIPDGLGNYWGATFLKETRNLIGENLKINLQLLKDFRKSFVLLVDIPESRQYLNVLNFLDGHRRGQGRLLKRQIEVLEENGFAALLKKYSCSMVGNPYVYKHKGYSVTWRWLKNVYYCGLFKKYLGEKIKSNFVIMDIGCGYGIFSYLLKNEFPRSCQILVDLPQQLVLSHYFLGAHFPEARIASFTEVSGEKKLDREFLSKYDFILLPWQMYPKVVQGSVDALTNFVSFAEMGRKYFDFYINQELFSSSKYFFTINRFVSAPTYDNGLSVLDYHLADFQKLHFGIFPLAIERYRRKGLFFYTYFPYVSQTFEFIGERNQ